MPDRAKDRYISTPELSFAIRRQQAHGGLNISASHNHPDDNGAKIYNEKGSQEIPPVDEELAKIVEATAKAKSMEFDEAVARGNVRWLPEAVSEAYLETNARVSRNRLARSAFVVFTPLHGTGFHSAGKALLRAGFKVEEYPGQAKPDGTFPNVPFRSPNPEVRESLSGARDFARSQNADLVLGTDPDADRLGMLAPHPAASPEREWVFFNGNEIGVVLTHYLLGQNGSGKSAAGEKRFAVTTVVTTSLFSRIARAKGVEVVDDLGVGFKYIADVLNTIEASGRYRNIAAPLEGFVIGIEESHGYLVVPSIRDKDAAGAAVLLAEVASVLKEQKRSLGDYLDDIYREFGYVRNHLVSTVMLGARGFLNIRKIQASLRARPPVTVGGRKVIEVSDRWSESGVLGKIKSETDRMSRDLLTFQLEGDARVILRPSGTESKNKVYVEVCGKPLGKSAPPEALSAEKERIDQAARELAKAFTKEMLFRIDVSLPDYALEISDLVALEYKIDFGEKFLPELLGRLELGESSAEILRWMDGRLKPYGADPRLMVAGAVRAYVKTADLPAEIARQLLEAVSS